MENELIRLARSAILSTLENKPLEIDKTIKEKFSEKKSCFVTLTLNGELRGCIGSLTPTKPLWKEVIENSINAAFNDFRFLPLSKKEFNELKIEISILSELEKIEYISLEDLFKKIKNKGVFIRHNGFSATYLPQVWNEIKSPLTFLSSLCKKAGLSSDFWKNKNLEFFTYNVDIIE
ncbi:AmmeMemoRadiSam system protein A [Candidatus Woesearchaeota archaeon]|nr:AmmeMemoRadiSam system protein A [Candidatus Woesearchaeota archaeon]